MVILYGVYCEFLQTSALYHLICSSLQCQLIQLLRNRESIAARHVTCLYLECCKQVVCSDRSWKDSRQVINRQAVRERAGWESASSSRGSRKAFTEVMLFREIRLEILQQRTKRAWQFPEVFRRPTRCRGGWWSQYH